jgi:hypothetical protein
VSDGGVAVGVAWVDAEVVVVVGTSPVPVTQGGWVTMMVMLGAFAASPSLENDSRYPRSPELKVALFSSSPWVAAKMSATPSNASPAAASRMDMMRGARDVERTTASVVHAVDTFHTTDSVDQTRSAIFPVL